MSVETIFFVLLVVLLLCLLVAVRAEIVYAARLRILDESRWDGEKFVEHAALPSFERMMLDLTAWRAETWWKRVHS